MPSFSLSPGWLTSTTAACLTGLALAWLLPTPIQAQSGEVNVTAALNSFLVGYDRRVRPNYAGTPVNVTISLYILSMSELSDKTMDYTMDLYFRQYWNDPRMSFLVRPGLEKLVVTADFAKQIWVPDTFFVNEKVASFHSATTDNEFLRILPSGDILRSIRVTVKAHCPLDLSHFPMDSQTCYLEIESYGHTMEDLFYSWHSTQSSSSAPDVALPQFNIMGFRRKTVEASLSSGNYSRLVLEFEIERTLGYYLLQVYIPASLIVLMSWISFWISNKASTARMMLCVTSVLTMTTLMGSVMSTLPKINYSTAMDKYLGICFFLVFSCLIEFAVVHFLQTRSGDSGRHSEAGEATADENREAIGTEQSKQVSVNILGAFKGNNPESLGRLSDLLDSVCRVLFPAIFAFFHIVYWGFYLNTSRANTADLD